MRKTLTIFLLLLFTAQTEMGQLYRLPFAVQHYFNHSQENNSLTLAAFLLEHYQVQHQDSDSAADNQLPFKSYNSEILSLIYVPATSPKVALHNNQMFQKPFVLYVRSPLCQRSFTIFHPPQAI